MSKKEAYYFSHDYSTTNDPKVQALLGKYGAKGYGIYWRVVEILHEEQDHKLYLKPYMFEAIASTFKEDVNLIKEIITYQVKVCELFKKKGKYIYSERVLENIDKRNKIKEVRSIAGQKSAKMRQQKAEIDANLPTIVKQNPTNVEQTTTKEIKVNEIKGKEIVNITIDWDKLMIFFNNTFNKKNRVFNGSNKSKYLARIKEGYERENIFNAMIKASKDNFHKENGFQYCTLEYFSRSTTLDKYGFEVVKKEVY
tara:strand:- start:10726 stop:11487 length:762 start_codon:yes stop_codon:yes gene_type:complete